jgi:hypothetical protein
VYFLICQGFFSEKKEFFDFFSKKNGIFNYFFNFTVAENYFSANQ